MRSLAAAYLRIKVSSASNSSIFFCCSLSISSCAQASLSKVATFKGSLLKHYPYFIFPLILLYLLTNIFDWNNGLLSHSHLDTQIANLNQKIDKTRKDNELYEIKIESLINFESTDLLDEQVRSVLGYGKNDEYVIYLD